MWEVSGFSRLAGVPWRLWSSSTCWKSLEVLWQGGGSEGQSSCSYVYSKKNSINIEYKNKSGHHIASFNKEAPFERRSYPLRCRSISVQPLPSTHTSEYSHKRMLAIFIWQKYFGENLNIFYYLIIARVPDSQIRQASAKWIARIHIEIQLVLPIFSDSLYLKYSH